MYEFHETVELEIPNIGAKFAGFEESETKKGLIIEVAAIHEGMTANHNFYSASELADSISTWVTPYPKPIIRNHDITDEAIGRVIAAKMDTEEDGTPYSRLQIAITDPSAIEKVMDERYLTGSVGGKAGEASCSVCGSNWSEASAYKAPCKHVRGKTYKVDGKEHKAHLKMGKLSFKEYSIVNSPADSRSGVRAMNSDSKSAATDEADGWVKAPTRIFAINMDKEEVLEYTESEDRDILSTMKRKDAAPLYLGLKGAYLSALAVQEFEEDEMEEEDILAVSEGLSADLAAATAAEEEVVEEAAEEEVTDSEEASKTHKYVVDAKGTGGDVCSICGAPKDSDLHDDADGDEPDDGPDGSDEESAEEVNDAEEADSLNNNPAGTGENRTNNNYVNRPQGQEKVHGRDVNSETSANAPVNRQSEDGEDGEEAVAEQIEQGTELNETIQNLESHVEELEARVTTLSEENARLKAALKGSLVERVVDTKISLGMISQDDREEELQEHLGRSAVSLADSLKDLTKVVPSVRNYADVPTVEGVISPIPVGKKDGNQEKVLTINVEEFEADGKKSIDPEEFFTDALMGRKKL